MNYTQEIKRDMDSFQNSVIKLSKGINSTSSMWRDEKYTELSMTILELSNQSRNIMMSGDKLCESINKFLEIAAEEY